MRRRTARDTPKAEIVARYTLWLSVVLLASALIPYGAWASGPGITIQGRTLSDACTAGGTGNGDGALDPGETVAMAVTALNGYAATAAHVVGTLTSTTPGVTVTTSTASFGDLAAGGTGSGDRPFWIVLSQSLACGATLDFQLTFESSQGNSSQGLSLLVGQATSGTTTTVLSETFESWPPPGWDLVPDPQTGGVWNSSSHPAGCISGSSYPYANNTGGTGLFADANSDCFGDAMDSAMVTPAFSLASPSYVSAQLQFKSDFFCLNNVDDAWVDVTTDDGAVWTNLLYFDHQSARGPSTRTIDLTPYLGQPNVRLSFEYESAGWDWYWQVDDVTVTAVQSGGCATNVCASAPCTLTCAATVPGTALTGSPVPFAATSTPTGGCVGSPSYSWAFGDGQSSTAQNPSHTYASTGSFTWSVATSIGGASACAHSGTILVGSPTALTVNASATPASGIVPLPVAFGATVAGGTAPYTYAWVFGDGAVASGANPSHTYSSAGSFTATVTVTDSASHVATASVTITAFDPLAVSCSASPSSGPPPLNVGLSASVSGGLPPYTFDWNFGDGSAHGSSAGASHQYLHGGTYTATLTVSDTVGNSATCSTTVVASVPPPVVASVRKVAPPFTLVVTGSNLQSGISVKVNSSAWSGVIWKSTGKIKVTGGASLKAAVPKGATTLLTFVNPDGGEASTTFTR